MKANPGPPHSQRSHVPHGHTSAVEEREDLGVEVVGEAAVLLYSLSAVEKVDVERYRNVYVEDDEVERYVVQVA